MPKQQLKITVNNNQDNESWLEPNNPTSVDPGKDPNIVFMNMIDAPREEMNKSLREIYENTNTQWKEIVVGVPAILKSQRNHTEVYISYKLIGPLAQASY